MPDTDATRIVQDFLDIAEAAGWVPAVLVVLMLLFFLGALPIPVGYERGKVKWVMWCGTGMHVHVVYRTQDHGFQTLHPGDRND